ncbi:hypothetical protein RP20_CCG013595 [Aedes albopictus]|nr:hypothetical protein RP20_CCG013595 [Aedes albopictus]
MLLCVFSWCLPCGKFSEEKKINTHHPPRRAETNTLSQEVPPCGNDDILTFTFREVCRVPCLLAEPRYRDLESVLFGYPTTTTPTIIAYHHHHHHHRHCRWPAVVIERRVANRVD